MSDPLDSLETRWEVKERPFASHTPLLGPLIARLRRLWNDVATTWYVRPLLQQQNEFNHLLVQYLRRLEEVDEELDGRLAAADHDQSDLARQLAELTTAVTLMNQRLGAIEAKLNPPEPPA